MSSMIILPYYPKTISSRFFDTLFTQVAKVNPGLEGLRDSDAAIGHVDLTRYPGFEGFRIALALREAFQILSEQYDLDDYQLLVSRIGWYIRDYLLLGDLVSQSGASDESGPDAEYACRLVAGAKEWSCDPYVFCVLVSNLFRAAKVPGADLSLVVDRRTLDFSAVGLDVDEVGSTVNVLLRGGDDYRICRSQEIQTPKYSEVEVFRDLQRFLALVGS